MIRDLVWGVALLLAGVGFVVVFSMGYKDSPSLTLTAAVLSALTGAYLIARVIDTHYGRKQHEDAQRKRGRRRP